MHMADALLSPAVGLAMNAVSAAAIGVSAATVSKDKFPEKKVPVIGVAGALVFAAQMINFTIPGTGSSGHIGGGILLSGLLGGVPAFLAISAVLIIQCLFFADGGLLALGCNIFNLGVIPCIAVYPLIFKPIMKGGAGASRLSAASLISAVAALQAGALCVVAQTSLSGIAALPFAVFAGLMLPIHLAIGLVEGIVTAAVLSFIWKVRPDIIDSEGAGAVNKRKVLKPVRIVFAAAALATGGALSLFASANPDGLEWAVLKTALRSTGSRAEPEAGGDIHEKAAEIQDITAFLPGYAFKSDPDSAAGTSLSGVIGAAITFTVAGASGLAISKLKRGKKARIKNRDDEGGVGAAADSGDGSGTDSGGGVGAGVSRDA